jgi:hypothetical protein
MNITHSIIMIVVSAAWIITFLAAVVSIGSVRLDVTPFMRGLWIALAVIFPVVGPIIWFIWARPHYLRELAHQQR